MTSLPKEEIGNRIVRLRVELGFNQLELAVKSGLKQATVSRIELNDVKQPGPDILGKLATALNTTVDYLIGRTNSPLPVQRFLPNDPTIEYFLKIYSKLERSEVPSLIRSIWAIDPEGTRDQLTVEIAKSKRITKAEASAKVHKFINFSFGTGAATEVKKYRGKIIGERKLGEDKK